MGKILQSCPFMQTIYKQICIVIVNMCTKVHNTLKWSGLKKNTYVSSRITKLKGALLKDATKTDRVGVIKRFYMEKDMNPDCFKYK